MTRSRCFVLTAAAMLAFAGNSLLCRLALRDGAIDPATFTALRLVSGAVALLLICQLNARNHSLRTHGSWYSAFLLFLYATTFSFAYLSLDAGVGALVLFAFVQGTMITLGLTAGVRPAAKEWAGWLAAFAGLVWLLLPGLSAPPVSSTVLMATSGIAWGIYSHRGRLESDALGATTNNFAMAAIIVPVFYFLVSNDPVTDWYGLSLAITSGALTSGVGYVFWYAAIPALTAMQAAMVQLTVPVIAATGGVLLLAEAPSLRLVVSAALVLGGLLLAMLNKAES